MCGIAGILLPPGGQVRSETLKAMSDAISWRGPDDEGQWCEDGVGLAHRRLSIFDLSKAGWQPMSTPDGRYFITYNGEVYNWPEIRGELDYRDWRSQTDTETILHAYSELGPDCLKLFNGIFALAIWDRKEQELFLARDRAGIKPLLWATHEGAFFFGSAAKRDTRRWVREGPRPKVGLGVSSVGFDRPQRGHVLRRRESLNAWRSYDRAPGG